MPSDIPRNPDADRDASDVSEDEVKCFANEPDDGQPVVGSGPFELVEGTAGGATIGSGALQAAKELADVGVDRIMVPAFAFWGDTADALKRYGDEVIAQA